MPIQKSMPRVWVVFPDSTGRDLPTGAKVKAVRGDHKGLAGVVRYRVSDGRDGRPRCGIEADGLTINGRPVKRICVDSKGLQLG